MQTAMSRLSPNILTGLFITLFCGLSFLIRTILPFDKIFTGGWIKFSSIDAYYHMYLVDNMANNFPNLTSFSPYFIYPDGNAVAGAHFFDWLLAGICWVVGLGSPTQHTVDVVSVYFPAILGALTVIPVFFIGKVLFNKWVGIIAAALIAVLPGEFLGRSILGFTDQHIAEVFFSSVAVLFLILTIKQARKNELTFSSIIQRDWKVIRRPLIYALLAGLFLGIYLITWQGGLLFVFIIGLYFVLQFIIDHLRGISTEYLGITGFIVFLLAMIIFLPLSPPRDVANVDDPDIGLAVRACRVKDGLPVGGPTGAHGLLTQGQQGDRVATVCRHRPHVVVPHVEQLFSVRRPVRRTALGQPNRRFTSSRHGPDVPRSIFAPMRTVRSKGYPLAVG